MPKFGTKHFGCTPHESKKNTNQFLILLHMAKFNKKIIYFHASQTHKSIWIMNLNTTYKLFVT